MVPATLSLPRSAAVAGSRRAGRHFHVARRNFATAARAGGTIGTLASHGRLRRLKNAAWVSGARQQVIPGWGLRGVIEARAQSRHAGVRRSIGATPLPGLARRASGSACAAACSARRARSRRAATGACRAAARARTWSVAAARAPLGCGATVSVSTRGGTGRGAARRRRTVARKHRPGCERQGRNETMWELCHGFVPCLVRAV